MLINICLDVWSVGGAELGYKRIASKLPNYSWSFTTDVDPNANLVIYSNNHRFYDQAKALNLPTIQRTTGPRSYSLPQPNDLKAVICSSIKGYEITKHHNKHLIYNGIDFEHLKAITPIPCDLLYAPARIGVGQCVETAIKYSKEHRRHLTVLGGKQHLHEDTYKILKRKYPEVCWTGLVDPNVASSYIKGCKAYICPTKTHGVSNAIIECVAQDKTIINLGGVEIPPKDQIDINVAANKYDALIKSVLGV
jgi:hypothetical protein